MAAYPSGFQPYRNSHFNYDEWEAAGYDRAFVEDYLGSNLDSYNHPNAAIEPRIPGIFQYYSIAEDELAKGFAGQYDSAQETADAIAAAWEKITDQIGRDSQIALYKASLGMPGLTLRAAALAGAVRRRAPDLLAPTRPIGHVDRRHRGARAVRSRTLSHCRSTGRSLCAIAACYQRPIARQCTGTVAVEQRCTSMTTTATDPDRLHTRTATNSRPAESAPAGS